MHRWAISVSQKHKAGNFTGGVSLTRTMRPWRRVFEESNIFYMDGERMAHDAGGEMQLLLDFLGAPKQQFTFENQLNKGFSCLEQPLPFCLNPAKGTSRKEDVYQVFPEITSNAVLHMSDEMRKNLSILGLKDYVLQSEICQDTAVRFQWYKRFVCPLPVGQMF